MLHRIDRFSDLYAGKLMEIYAESNLENTDYFYPELTDKAEAVKKVEEGFLNYLEQDFFQGPGPSYWVLEVDGRWVSALRLNEIKPRFFYLEALETRPDARRMGFGARLLRELIAALQMQGGFTICDCVGKRNEASLRTHLKCGFEIVSQEGWDYLSGEASERTYGMRYRFASEV